VASRNLWREALEFLQAASAPRASVFPAQPRTFPGGVHVMQMYSVYVPLSSRCFRPIVKFYFAALKWVFFFLFSYTV